MWKAVNGELVNTTDVTRVEFRTNISQSILDKLRNTANEQDTFVNYLLETGLEEVLERNVINFTKDARPKDRVQYKTTYDKELLENIKAFAKKNKLATNDVIEYSASFVDIENSKKKSHRDRIE